MEQISAQFKSDRIRIFKSLNKNTVLTQLAETLSSSPNISNKEELSKAIFSREQLMSTGIGLGIGVPHVRLNTVSDLTLAFGISTTPIKDYESLDGAPVQLICMIAANTSQHAEYLRTLAKISEFLKSESFRTKLIAAADLPDDKLAIEAVKSLLVKECE